MKLFSHIRLVMRHRHQVFKHAVKCGIPYRGLVHDLSKFSPVELFESAKYYQGNRSPIGACRRATGISYAWLHHKGCNKHHLEYWNDDECAVQPMIPYPYLVECICDKLAATKVYLGKEYTEEKPLEHFLKYGNKVRCNEKCIAFIEAVFRDLAEHGEDFILNKAYLKKQYQQICLQ